MATPPLTLEEILAQAQTDLGLLQAKIDAAPTDALLAYKERCLAKIADIQATIAHNAAYEAAQAAKEAEKAALLAQLHADIGADLAPKVDEYYNKYGFL